MSSPPDFLGMALGMMNQRRQQQSQTMDTAQRAIAAKDRTELAQRRYEESRQDKAFGNALSLIKEGRDPEAVFGLYGDQLRYGDLKFLKAEAKSIKDSSLAAANTPKGTEMEDVATGLAAIQQNNPDPLRGALDRIRAELALKYPDPIKARLGSRADFISQAQQAAAARETERVTQQSKITEERQKRMLGEKAALKTGEKAKEIPPAVQSAWLTYKASGMPLAVWMKQSDSSVPTMVKNNAMRHPEYIAIMEKLAAPKTGRGGLTTSSTTQVTGGAPSTPAQAAGGWVDIGGGVRVRKKE